MGGLVEAGEGHAGLQEALGVRQRLEPLVGRRDHLAPVAAAHLDVGGALDRERQLYALPVMAVSRGEVLKSRLRLPTGSRRLGGVQETPWEVLANG